MATFLNPRYPSARRSIISTRDQDGRRIALVHLPHGACARLYLKDFKRLMRLGVPPNWCLNKDGTGSNSYVRAGVPAEFGWTGTLMMLARVIVPPRSRGQVICYRDGNPLNLRRDNLEIVRRKTGAKAREHLLENRRRIVGPVSPHPGQSSLTCRSRGALGAVLSQFPRNPNGKSLQPRR